ncbi:Protodermal factor 2 [Corchorus olitorius]|uniref:Protodermal factor 2 n=1 Tax=Corchorus olitorius TaxID=93759 RepID=A0A1R3J3G8_9ROSI|nr:Protodermal factor 2 [Corchorus olitorius]
MTEEVECSIISGTASNQNKVKLRSTAVSGFTIMPDGPGGLNCNGALVTCIKQLNCHPGIAFR